MTSILRARPKPRAELALAAAGVLAETANPSLYNGSAAPGTQVVFGFLLGLRSADVVTGVMVRNITAAVAANPTTARVGIADSTGKILAISGNLNAAANFPVGACPLPFAAQYTVLADGGYYACIVVNGVWGTPPALIRFTPANANQVGAYSTNAPPAFSWSGQTDLPAVNSSLTLTTGPGSAFYMGFY